LSINAKRFSQLAKAPIARRAARGFRPLICSFAETATTESPTFARTSASVFNFPRQSLFQRST